MDLFVQSELVSKLVEYATTPSALWAAFGVMVGITAVISSILYYHWRHYGVNRHLIRRVQTVYFFGTIILVLGSFISLIFYLLV